MDPFRGLGMPRIPGLTELLSLLQTQTEALAQLPRTLSDLNGTVRELTEATTMAHATIASAQRIAERLEDLVQELEEPVRAQRRSIDAMRSQLEAFDQQLAVFERILDPLVEWSSTWARLEEAVGDFVRRDQGDHPGADDHR